MFELFKSEKWAFLSGSGGMRAAFFYGLKTMTKIEVFRLVWIKPLGTLAPTLPGGWRYLRLDNLATLSALPATLLTAISAHSGSGPERLFQRAGSLHLLLCGDQVVAQLNIESAADCQIDDPQLMLKLAQTDVFLGYLFTWPSFRRLGAAQHLIAATQHDLASRGVERIIAHVRATNVPSLAAFARSGWCFDGLLFSRCSGRFLAAQGLKKLKLVATAPAPLE